MQSDFWTHTHMRAHTHRLHVADSHSYTDQHTWYMPGQFIPLKHHPVHIHPPQERHSKHCECSLSVLVSQLHLSWPYHKVVNLWEWDTHTLSFSHTHTHIHKNMNTHTHTLTQAHVHTHTHMNTHTYTHRHACTHTHTRYQMSKSSSGSSSSKSSASSGM